MRSGLELLSEKDALRMGLQPVVCGSPEVGCFAQSSQRAVHSLPALGLEYCSVFPLSLTGSCLFFKAGRCRMIQVGSPNRAEGAMQKARGSSMPFCHRDGALSQITDSFCPNEAISASDP